MGGFQSGESPRGEAGLARNSERGEESWDGEGVYRHWEEEPGRRVKEKDSILGRNEATTSRG
jgi:hypothetical protein